MVEFVSLWRCRVDQNFYSTPFNEFIESPLFRTVHKGVGFDWSFHVFPNGKKNRTTEEEVRDHLSLYLNLDLGNLSCTTAQELLFIEIGGKKLNWTLCDKDLLHQDLSGENRWGYCKFLQRTDQAEFETKYCRDGHVTFGIHFKIQESEFDVERLYKEKRSKFLDFKPYDNLEHSSQFRSFDQIHAKKTEKKPRLEIPETDKWTILDFQIFSKDNYVIFCHKFVLVMNNEKFSTLIGAGLAESQKSSSEVEYTCKTMMEVLHNIYRCAPSADLEGLVLNEVILAAEDYNLPDLKLRCEQQLIQELTIQNSAEFLEQAHLYNLTILKNVAMNLITENLEVVRMSERGKG